MRLRMRVGTAAALLAFCAGCGFSPLHARSNSACAPTTVLAVHEAREAPEPEALAAALDGARAALREEGARCGRVEVALVRSSYRASAIGIAAQSGARPQGQATDVRATVHVRLIDDAKGGRTPTRSDSGFVTVAVPVPASSDARTAALGEERAIAQAAFEAARRGVLRALGHPTAGDDPLAEER